MVFVYLAKQCPSKLLLRSEVGRILKCMYYVYILTNDRDRKYIGFSEDLKSRLNAHKSKSVKTTKTAGNMKLAFYAAFKNKAKALAFEKYLKQGSGFAFTNKHLV